MAAPNKRSAARELLKRISATNTAAFAAVVEKELAEGDGADPAEYRWSSYPKKENDKGVTGQFYH
jgi:hypothetical protein